MSAKKIEVEIEGVVKTEAITYRWGWDMFRIGWVEKMPRFSFQVAKNPPIHIPIEDLNRMQEILDDLRDTLEDHNAYD